MAILVYLMLIGVIPYADYTIDNPTYLYLSLNLHAGAFLFMSVEILILYLWRQSDYKNKVYPVVFTVYGVLGQMSDSTPLMILFGPLCVYGAYYLIWPKVEKNRKKNIFLIADSVFIVAAAAAINKLVSFFGGMTILGSNFNFNTAAWVLRNIKLCIIRILSLFGYDTKYGITLTPYVLIVVFILLLIAASVIYQIVLAVRSKPDPFGLLLSLGIISNITGVLFIFSGYDTVSGRHLMSVPFFGSVLAAKFIFALMRRKGLFTKILPALILIITTGYTAYNVINLRNVPHYGDDGEAVAAYIREKGGGDGYGSLWIYTSIAAYTDFESTVIPVRWTGYGDGFSHHNLLINRNWYEKTDLHYVVLLTDENDLYAWDGKKSDFIKFAGEPDEDKVFGMYEIMYYEQDLSQYDLVKHPLSRRSSAAR